MQQGDAVALATEMRAGCLGVRIGRLHRLVSRAFEQELRAADLTLPQLEMLSTLTLVGKPLRPSLLADYLAVERSTISRNLGVLVERGLVAVASSTPSGRAQTVTVTAAGRRRLTKARRGWEAAQARLVGVLGADAVTTLDGWLGGLTGPVPGGDSPDRD